MWVLFNAAFVSPLVLAAVMLRKFKHDELERLHAEIEHLRRNLRWGPGPIKDERADRLAFLQQLYGVVQSMPESLFSWRHFTASIAATAAPFVGILTVLKGFSK